MLKKILMEPPHHRITEFRRFTCLPNLPQRKFYLLRNLNNRTEITAVKSSGHYMYRQFNITQYYVLPTQFIYVFCVDLRTNSDYFPTQN